jgi:hypothetical protein
VLGNPITHIDPTGEITLQQAAGVAVGVIAACRALKKFFDTASDGLDRGKGYQEMENANQDWLKGGMQGQPPYSEEQLRDARNGVVNSAADTAVTATGVPGTSLTPGLSGPGNLRLGR